MKRIVFAIWFGLALTGHGLSEADAAPPKQASGIKVVHQAGQTFITFADPEDTLGEAPAWGKVRQYQSKTDGERKVRYRIYRRDKPIDAGSLAAATLLAEVEPLSGINVNSWSFERLVNQIVFSNDDQGELGKYGPFSGLSKDSPEAEKLLMPRFAIEDGKALPPGTGLYVHSPAEKGRAYYAVTAVAGGQENKADFSAANSLARPVAEEPGTWRPVEQPEGKPFGFDFRGKRHFYVTWVAPPLAPKAMYFNWSVLVPPDCTSPAPVELYFHPPGGSYARPPVKFLDKSIQIVPHDYPFSGWYGYNDALWTGGDASKGKVQPYTIRRIEAFLKWAEGKFPVDPKRVVAVGRDGAMMVALYRPERLAYLVSMGFEGHQLSPKAADEFAAAWGPKSAEITNDKGLSEWGWGKPDVVLTGKVLPNNTNNKAPAPEMPAEMPGVGVELPLFVCGGRSWGVDPGYARGRGRLYYALQGTRHPLYGRWGWRNADYPSKFSGEWYGLDITKDAPIPAITNSSADVDSEAEGHTNGWHRWEPVKEDAEAVTMVISGRDCTFDVTPRRLQKFKTAPGEKIAYEVTSQMDPQRQSATQPVPVSGIVQADKHGLVTIKSVKIDRYVASITIRLSKAK